jgi:hypothetical protein
VWTAAGDRSSNEMQNIHLQQHPKTHLARRKCVLCCLDGRTLSTADVMPACIDNIDGWRAASYNQYFSNSIQKIKR